MRISMQKVIELLEEYKAEFGNLRITKRYKTKDGISLGLIVYAIRHGERQYTEEEKRKLDELGFMWVADKYKMPIKYSFEGVLEMTKAYIRDSGSQYINSTYMTHDGVPLGRILYNIKTNRRRVTAEEKEALENTGIKIKKVNRHINCVSFEEIVKILKDYEAEYGTVNVKTNYLTPDGISIGKILSNIRRGVRVLTSEQRDILTNMGFNWQASNNVISMGKVKQLIREYKSIYGDCRVPMKYVTPDGIPLGMIVNSIRNGNRRISEEDVKQLNEAGFIWKTHDRRKALSFNDIIFHLKQYKKMHGDLLVPVRYVTEDNINLGGLVHNIRTGSRRITEKQRKKLSNIGFVWHARNTTGRL